MAPDLGSASTIATQLQAQGAYYLAALAIVGMVSLFLLLLRVQHLRVTDMQRMQDQRVALAESVIPVAKDLAAGTVALKAIARELLEATPPKRRKTELSAVKDGES